MNRTLAGAAATAILLPAGIFAVMLAAPANADEPPGPPPPPPGPAAPAANAASPEMLAAMERDLDLTATEARERIARDNAAGRKAPALRKKLGSAFGGAWLTADAESFVVAVTDSDKAAEVTAAGATPKLVDRSAAELDAVKARLDKAADKAPTSGVPGWYVDPKTNTVVVQARGNTAAARAFIKASGVDADAVRVVRTNEQPTTAADVRGGDYYHIDRKDTCSIGFSVYGGFVSAGHCGKVGAKTIDPKGAAQGVFMDSSFPGDNDYAFVQVNPNWTSQPWVNDGKDGNLIVSGFTSPTIGATACRSGATTGWRCGTVLALNQTANYKEGEVSGLTRLDACAGAGDSGGSVLSGQLALGIVSGKSGDCGSGGTSYVQPIGEILSDLELTLVTSDEIASPVASRSCKGFKNSATGSLDDGSSAYVPDGSYYYATAGTHTGCLTGPAGSNFDLSLHMYIKGAWTPVATSESAAADEGVFHRGAAGYYTWKVSAAKGSSGNFAMGFNHP